MLSHLHCYSGGSSNETKYCIHEITRFHILVLLAAVTAIVIWLGLEIVKWHKKNRADWMPTDNRSPPRDQPSVNTISASVPPAAPAPRMRRASEPTPPATTPGHPTSRYPLSLSSRLSHAYYTHHDGFSSPIIASHMENPRNHVSSSRTWHAPTSLAPSVPFPSSYSPSIVPGHTPIPFAANVQPPEYPTVWEDNTGLPTTYHTTHATDEGPPRVFEPSNDGLPSYEAAMSTRQPPAYEAPRTPRDDVPTTND